MTQRRKTEKVELVETHNIMLSLDRVNKAGGSWRRALYHALGMSAAVREFDLCTKIREALKLP